MHNIIIAKPYKFVPPRFSPFWAALIRWYLPRYLRNKYGVTSWECIGHERLVASLNDGCGVLLAANHCRPCDPMVMGLLGREVKKSFHVMASWHLFMQDRIMAFLLPRIGAFSVYREGLDRESLKCATRILVEGSLPLVVFPEGFITRNNDKLFHLMDGVAFLARSAQKQKTASSRPGRVVVHPVFIRYFFEGDPQTTVSPILRRIERRLSWRPQDRLPLRDRAIKAGHALLALKEIEYRGSAQSGTASERLKGLLDALLSPLEAEWGTHDGDAMLRIKRLRSAIIPDMADGDLPEAERARRWRQLDDLYLAQQLHCYSGDYLAGNPTPERLLETAERYEEDLTDHSGPHAPIRAVITVGEAIEAQSVRERHREEDPVATQLRQAFERMLVESSAHRRTQPYANNS